ncbi:MAG: hypothetical protein ACKO7W_02545 [Elainella sp.]
MKKRFPKNVEDKASRILSELAQGKHWSRIDGYAYKMRLHDLMLVFRLPGWHRLVCWFKDDLLRHAELMSHERYNAVVSKPRQ